MQTLCTCCMASISSTSEEVLRAYQVPKFKNNKLLHGWLSVCTLNWGCRIWEQFDMLLAQLTVPEMLLCTALLKCSMAESLD